MSRRFLPLCVLVLWSATAHAQVCYDDPDVAPIMQIVDDATEITLTDPQRASLVSCLEQSPAIREAILMAAVSSANVERSSDDVTELTGAASPALGGRYNNRSFGYRAGAPQTAAVTSGGRQYRLTNHIFTSPILLDLNQDGLLGVADGEWRPSLGLDLSSPLIADFDINADGFAEVTEWFDGSDGLLVAPRNPAFVSNNGGNLEWVGETLNAADLVGTHGGFQDGFEKLATFDTNADGSVSGNELVGLYIWQDFNVNATIEIGELHTPTDLAISRLNLPSGTCTGTFTRNANDHAMWDWWPSFSIAHLGDGTYEPNQPVSLVIDYGSMPGPGGAPNPQATFPISSSTLITSSQLSAAGLNPTGLQFGGIDQDASRIVMYESAGYAYATAAVHVFTSTNTELVYLRSVPVPLQEIQQVLLDSDRSALVVGDGGAKLVSVPLYNGDPQVVHERVPGVSGFRCDARTRSFPDGTLEFTGRYYDRDGTESSERLVQRAPGQQDLVPLEDLDSTRDQLFTQFGAYPSLVSDDCRIIWDRVSERGMLIINQGGTYVDVAPTEDVALTGFAGAGESLLYFRKEANGVTPVIFDRSDSSTLVLNGGTYTYPAMANNGRRAAVAEIDLAQKHFSLLATAALPGAELEPIVTNIPLTSYRLSGDGRRALLYGQEGFRIQSLRSAADVDGDGDGDADDLFAFTGCMDGPDLQLVAQVCRDADADDDGDADLRDFALMQRCARGPDQAAPRTCP